MRHRIGRRDEGYVPWSMSAARPGRLRQDALFPPGARGRAAPRYIHIGEESWRDFSHSDINAALFNSWLAKAAAQRVVSARMSVHLGGPACRGSSSPAREWRGGPPCPRRPDRPSPRRTDLARARCRLAHHVHLAVHAGSGWLLGDAQVLRAHRHALLLLKRSISSSAPRIETTPFR